jgi:hypothetical protein
MIDFKKLFADVAKYPDTLKLKIGDTEMDLGVLRAWNTENQGALVGELESQRKALAAENSKLELARKEVASQYLDVMDLKKKYEGAPITPTSTTPPDPYASLVDDPIAGALAKIVKANQESVTADVRAIREENKKLLDAIGKMGTTYMNDRAGQDYSALTSDPDFDAKDESLSQQKLYESAVRSGYRDPSGIPDIRKAYREATSEKRMARLIKDAREDERKKMTQERRQEAILPRPSGPRTVGEQPPVAFKDLNGALEAAMQDTAIWNQATGEA